MTGSVRSIGFDPNRTGREWVRTSLMVGSFRPRITWRNRRARRFEVAVLFGVVVQLAETVGQLEIARVELEALGHARVGSLEP